MDTQYTAGLIASRIATTTNTSLGIFAHPPLSCFFFFFKSTGELHRVALSEADGDDHKGDKHS